MQERITPPANYDSINSYAGPDDNYGIDSIMKPRTGQEKCITDIVTGSDKIANIADSVRYAMGEDPAHGWPHVERVLTIADSIARNYCDRINREVLALALVLHDIGRFTGDSNRHHAVVSAEEASRILREHGYEPTVIDAVKHAIIAHSWSLGLEARTLEAMIVSDSDKLDALGAVGIARVFHTGCQMNRGFEDSIGHFYEKILRIPEKLYLPESKAIAEERLQIVKMFLEAWRREVNMLE